MAARFVRVLCSLLFKQRYHREVMPYVPPIPKAHLETYRAARRSEHASTNGIGRRCERLSNATLR